MANIEQQNSSLIWQYFTPEELFIKCIICNVHFNSCDVLFDIYLLHIHLEREHSHIIEKLKEEIKSTWLSRYFAFNIKCESIRCIFCEKDIRVLDGVNLQHHMLGHNVHEDTINYLKDDKTMQLNLSPEIYVKIIQKIQDEITSAGLSLYFIFDILSYGYTKMKCTFCDHIFNILLERQILKEHLFLHHYIIIENNANTSTGDQHAAESQTAGDQRELQW